MKLALALLALSLGCARRAPLPSPPASARPGELVVTLAWSAPVDLDLYVTEPGLETVYYANPRSRGGGALERDARCADAAGGPREERIRWTAPPAGRYRVGVDYPEACARAGREVDYRLVIEANGRRAESTHVAHRGAREPDVLDVAVEGRTP